MTYYHYQDALSVESWFLYLLMYWNLEILVKYILFNGPQINTKWNEVNNTFISKMAS